MFGPLSGRSRWLSKAAESEVDPWLLEGWEEGEGEKVGPSGESRMESFAESTDKGWKADQVWGFMIVDGARYYVRKIVAKKGDETVKIRLVYDWQGKK